MLLIGCDTGVVRSECTVQLQTCARLKGVTSSLDIADRVRQLFVRHGTRAAELSLHDLVQNDKQVGCTSSALVCFDRTLHITLMVCLRMWEYLCLVQACFN